MCLQVKPHTQEWLTNRNQTPFVFSGIIFLREDNNMKLGRGASDWERENMIKNVLYIIFKE